MHKLVRITTIAQSLKGLLKGQLNYLNQFYEVVGVASNENILKDVSEQEKIRTIHIGMNRQISPINDLCSLVKLIKLFLSEKPDIVHANTPKASLLSMIAAWLCRVPIRIYTVTGLRYETTTGLIRSVLIMMEKITCACANHVIPEGDGVKKTLIREGITKKPLNKILNGNINGIDTHFFNPDNISDLQKQDLKASLGIKPEDFVFVFIGRLVGDKGINELVRAFNSLNIPKTKLLLVGSSESELDPLQAETLNIIESNKNIITTGFQKDVRPYLAVSNALAFPSYREGFPNVVMQAGAMGLPSIVTDINGCNEIIVEGINGTIIAPKDENLLLDKMKYFIENPQVVSRLASQSRKMIVERYEQQAFWDALLQEYKRLEAVYLNKV